MSLHGGEAGVGGRGRAGRRGWTLGGGSGRREGREGVLLEEGGEGSAGG